MATPKQIAANRENAKKSTGPKTEEGKARSCLGRYSHGFTSRKFLLKEEDADEFWALLADFLNEFQPETPFEQATVEKMTQCHWNSQRANQMQAEVWYASRCGENKEDHPTLALMMRYQAANDREYHRAHATFIKHRKERLNGTIGFESQNTFDATPPAPPEPPAPQPDPPESPETPTDAPETDSVVQPKFDPERYVAEQLAQMEMEAQMFLNSKRIENAL